MSRLKGYTYQQCLALPDATLPDFIESACLDAQSRVWACIFLVDPRPSSDPDLRVRRLLKALADAAYRGLDVRLLVPWSATPPIAIANRTAIAYAHTLGVPARLASERAHEGSHSKYLVIDDDCSVIGSHNWTGRAFGLDAEDSLCLWSRDLAAELTDLFDTAWRTYHAV